jgi:hypothetical protein
VGRITCRIHRSVSSGGPGETLVKVGDWVRVRTDGGSPAARKYAGRKRRVTMIAPGLDETILDIRMVGNSFDTVLEEGDLGAKEKEGR